MAQASIILLFLCGCLLQHAASTGVKYTSCGSHSPLTVKSLSVSPDPPQVGQPVTITVHANSREEVTGGRVYFNVRGKGILSFIKFKQEKDLCQVLPTGCPIAKGDLTLTGTVEKDIASNAPAGTYDVELKVRDRYGTRELLCADLEITLH